MKNSDFERISCPRCKGSLRIVMRVQEILWWEYRVDSQGNIIKNSGSPLKDTSDDAGKYEYFCYTCGFDWAPPKDKCFEDLTWREDA